jgi:hypothetical protein
MITGDEMKRFILALYLFIITTCTSCFADTIFENGKHYKVKLSNLSWSITIEGAGDIYLKGDNIIYGRNWDSTFTEISAETGEVLNVLNPHTVKEEKKPLIVNGTTVYKDGYSLIRVVTNSQKYADVTLKSLDRQYRGDNETYYLVVKTNDGKEITFSFKHRQFESISDITHLKDGKFIITFNCTAGYDKHNFISHIGLLDLDKIIK